MRSRDRNYFENITRVYFVTTTIVGFLEILDEDIYRIIINDLRYYQDRRDFVLISYVLMPNHIHLVLNTKEGHSISQCMGNLKRLTSRHITSYLQNNNDLYILEMLKNNAALEPAKDCRVWKPRFDCLVIFKEETLIQKIQYCHLNPVRKGLAITP